MKSMNNNALCFTGHRPQKLPYGFDEENELCIRLKARLTAEIEIKIECGVDTFLCGMALGTDIWCGEIVIKLKEQFPNIRLIACIPHTGQEKSWNDDYKERYARLLDSADHSIVLYVRYVRGCMQKRNRYMVDNSAHMIAVYNGSAGGTQTTVEYAKRKGLDIIILDPNRMMRSHIKSTITQN